MSGRPVEAGAALAGFAALSLLGLAVLLLLPPSRPVENSLLAGAAVCALALARIDVRWLVIPDLYVVALAVPALFGPLSLGPLVAAAGAVVAGGLVWGVRWAFKRRTGVEGLGFGDVKLAAALGALLGPELALYAICAASVFGVVLGLATRRASAAEPQLIPLGAPLALVGVALLYWRRFG